MVVEHPHSTPHEEVCETLRTSPEGLSHDEARRRLEEHGENRLPEAQSAGLALTFLRQFKSPLIYVLMVAGGISLWMQEVADAIFIAIVLLFNAIVGTIQEYSASKAAAALQRLVSPRAVVMRGGEKQEIDAKQVVPGDIVLLESGAQIPADLRLTDSKRLQINQSMLTGESEAVEKSHEAKIEKDAPRSEQHSMAFSGTLVTHGRGCGVVVATGGKTAIGAIARSVMQSEGAVPPLMKRMERFTYMITIAILVSALILGVISWMRGESLTDIILISIGLAVAAIPEGLPIAVTVALAIGMRRMAERQVIVRRLVAVESLGSCTLIATDKTGTLTRNQLTARKLILPSGRAIDITQGSGMTDGDLKEHEGAACIDTAQESGLRHLLEAAVLANEGKLAKGDDGEWHGEGDQVDVALLALAHKAGSEFAALREECEELDRIPYESKQKYAAAFYRMGGPPFAYVKGAAEALIDMCGRDADGNPLNVEAIREQEKKLAGEQLRVLAFACGEVPEKKGYDHEDLQNLTFLGLIGFLDPLRENAAEAVELCRKAGLIPVMVTGDQPDTAFSIASELGLCESPEEVITGRELRGADERQLDAHTSKARVYARMEPEQKEILVRSLTRQGHHVAVTGDGVNDAPALNQAHVGVAMGKSGTDVARESADIILTDDNFASIINGIEEGRIAYNNIRKVVYFLISCGIVEILMFYLAVIFAMPVPLFAVQLLWLNMVTNGVQDVALAFEPGEGDELTYPPRPPNEPVFNRLMVERLVVAAIAGSATCFGVFYYYTQATGMSDAEARNLTVLYFVFFGNIMALSSRSETHSIFNLNFFRNRFLLIGILVADLIHFGAMYTPWLSDVLQIAPVPFSQWGPLLGLSLIVLATMEAEKWFRRRFRSP